MPKRPTRQPPAESRNQRRKPSADGQDRRGEIIDRATELFASRGFARTSLEEIMSVLGMSGPAFYYYFDAKPDVLFAMLDDALNTAEEAIDSLEQDDSLDPMERAIGAIVTHADVIFANQDAARVLFTESRELPSQMAEAIRRRMREHSLRIAGLYALACGKDPKAPEVWGVTGLLLGMANWISFVPRGSRDWELVIAQQLPVMVASVLQHMADPTPGASALGGG